MIAADTSTWIAFLEGREGEEAQLLDQALEDRQVLMVPVVLTELLSDPKLPSGVTETLSEVQASTPPYGAGRSATATAAPRPCWPVSRGVTAQVMDSTLVASHDLLLGRGTIRTMKN
jgi:hypothetical protein